MHINKQTHAKKNNPSQHTAKYEDLYWNKINNTHHTVDKGNNKITELRTILQRESPNS